MLKLVIKGLKEPVEFDQDRITIGRSSSNTAVLEGGDVSACHAEIHCDGQDVYLVDLGSTNGTKVNGKTLKGRRQLRAWDTVTFGSTEAEVVDTEGRRPTEVIRAVGAPEAVSSGSPAAVGGPWKLVGSEGEFVITGRHVLGRGDGCEIRLRSQSVSRRHAEIKVENGRLTVKDLGSANGTFVNGKRVEQRVLRPMDEIRFDEESFRVHGPTDLNRTSLRPAVRDAGGTEVRAAVGAGGTRVVKQPAFRLEVVAGMSSKMFELSRDSYVVGRSPQSDLVLAADSVSARHAELKQTNGAWRLTDLRSTNGSFVNDRKVETAELKPGDEVRFGEVGLRLVAPEGVSTGTAVYEAAVGATRVEASAVADPTLDHMTAPPPEKPSAVSPWVWAAAALLVVVGVLGVFSFLRNPATPDDPPPNGEDVVEVEPQLVAPSEEEADEVSQRLAREEEARRQREEEEARRQREAEARRRAQAPDPPGPPPARNTSLWGGNARLLVETAPPGVEVRMDGQRIGNTPIDLEGLAPGSRTIVLDHPEFRTVTRTNQRLQDNRVLEIRERMVFAVGALTVETTPRDVRIEIDGILRASQSPTTIDGVEAGFRQITLRADGYAPMNERVLIRKGEVETLVRTLTPRR